MSAVSFPFAANFDQKKLLARFQLAHIVQIGLIRPTPCSIAAANAGPEVSRYPHFYRRAGRSDARGLPPLLRLDFHAEVVTMKRALSRLNQVSLEDCTIYTNAEPCALCCYAMRETGIGRVVFGILAPLTGGLSRWNILADVELSNTLPEVFAPPPEIVPGFMYEQVEAAMARRTPITWEFIRARNIFGGPLPAHLREKLSVKPKDSFQERLMSFLRRQLFDYLGRK